MPKDGESSLSLVVEVEFEQEKLWTQVKYKDLNPFGTKKLVFQVKLIFLTEPKRSASSLIFAPPSKSSLWSSFSYVARVVQAGGGWIRQREGGERERERKVASKLILQNWWEFFFYYYYFYFLFFIDVKNLLGWNTNSCYLWNRRYFLHLVRLIFDLCACC